MKITTKLLTRNWTVVGILFVGALLFKASWIGLVLIGMFGNAILTVIFFINGGNNQEGMAEDNAAYEAKEQAQLIK